MLGSSYVLPNSQRCAELFFIQANGNQLDNCFVLYNLLQTSVKDSFPNPRRADFFSRPREDGIEGECARRNRERKKKKQSREKKKKKDRAQGRAGK